MNCLKPVTENNQKKACTSKNHIVGLCSSSENRKYPEKARSAIRTDTYSKKANSLYHYGLPEKELIKKFEKI